MLPWFPLLASSTTTTIGLARAHDASVAYVAESDGVLLVTADQLGIDVTLTLESARASVTVDSHVGDHGREFAVLDVTAGDPVSVKVAAFGGDGPPGIVRLQLSVLDPLRDADALKGFAAASRAGAVYLENNEQAFTSAIELLAQAVLELPASSPSSLSFMLIALGSLERALGEMAAAQEHFRLAQSWACRALAMAPDCARKALTVDPVPGALDRCAEVVQTGAMANCVGARQIAQLALARSTHLLGNVLWRAGAVEAGIRDLAQARERYRALALPLAARTAAMDQCLAMLRSGRYRDSVRCHRSLIGEVSDAGVIRHQSILENNLGLSLELSGEFPQALRHYEQALALRERFEQSLPGWEVGRAKGLLNRSRVLTRIGRYQAATRGYLEALQLFLETGERLALASTLTGLGELYAEVGDQALAGEYLLAARRLAQAIGDPVSLADILTKHGQTLAAQQQAGAAESIYQQAIQSLDGGLNPVVEAKARIAYAHLLLDQQRAEDAQLQLGLVALGELETHEADLLAAHLLARARTQLHSRNPIDATQSAERALAILERSGNRTGEVSALALLAEASMARQDPAQALALASRAEALVSSLRASIAGPGLVARFYDARSGITEVALRACHALYQRSGDAEYLWRALRLSDRHRARTLAQSLARSKRESALPSTLGRKRQSVALAITQALGALVQAPNAQTQQHLLALLLELDDLYSDDQGPLQNATDEAPTLPDLSREALLEWLDANECAIEYFVGATSGFIFRLCGRTLTMHEGPTREQVNAAVDAYLLALRSANTVGPGDAATLVRPIVAPVLRGVRAQRLLIVPDGELHRLPFAALPMPQASTVAWRSAALLLEQFEIVKLPSLQLAAQRRDPPPKRSLPRSLVIADPVFSGDDPRAARQSVHGGPERALPRLSSTRREADFIEHHGGPSEVHVLQGYDANKSVLLAEDLTAYEHLHIASHAQMEAGVFARSGIHLSYLRPDGSPLDGFLGVHEIASLRLANELTVLSACQTSAGETAAGEGMLGLARAFMIAGSDQVIGSLWRVPSRATAMLMAQFYDVWLPSRSTSVSALTAAQRHARRHPDFSHPYFWAAFEQHGIIHGR